LDKIGIVVIKIFRLQQYLSTIYGVNMTDQTNYENIHIDTTDKNLRVGTIVRLNNGLNNTWGGGKNSTGICYEVYTIGHTIGYSFIFENGDNSGFSVEEIQELLIIIGNSNIKYTFKSVIILTNDYRKGIFKEIFEAIKNIHNKTFLSIGARLRK